MELNIYVTALIFYMMIIDRIDYYADRLGFIPPSFRLNEILKDYKVIQPSIFPCVVDQRGVIYDINSQGLVDVNNTYLRIDTSDLRSTDIVFDVGSHIGEFGIMASKSAKHVYAFEPLTHDWVSRNADLNGRENITVIPCGIGAIGEQDIKYFSKMKRVSMRPLSVFVKAYGCDFLNSNCEGGEWTYTIDDLIGIRRIEIEFHLFSKNKRLELIDEIKKFFNVVTEQKNQVIELHGWNHNV